MPIPRRWPIFDVGAVSLFAAIGRLSHDEGLTPSGWWHTAWPFLAGVVLAHLLLLGLALSARQLRSGVLVWLVTWAGGMALRAVSDQGTAPSFVVVALVVLGVFLLVPRVVTGRLRGQRRLVPDDVAEDAVDEGR
ncbi:MAG: DUF3054 domain-containing protein [Nocardioidaceae bacterium]